jgi:hypothetical protein
MKSVRLYLSLLSGVGAIALFSSCSNVEFSKGGGGGANATCNGSAINCTPGGPGGNNAYDYVYTVPTPRVDILFVVDNSLSMGNDQAKLATAFNDFASGLGGADWQAGITTTDMTASGAGGKLIDISTANGPVKLLNSSTPNVSSAFNSAISGQGEGGSNDERGLLSALRLVQAGASNGFVRANSHTAIIILSDEDERSLGRIGGNDPTLALIPEEQPTGFADGINAALHGTGHSLYSVIVRPGDEACLNAQMEPGRVGYEGRRYFEAQALIAKRLYNVDLDPLSSPEVGNICDSNFNYLMSIIGNTIKQRVDPITLPCTPVGGKVKVNGSEITIPARQITIVYSPGTAVRLQFECAP